MIMQRATFRSHAKLRPLISIFLIVCTLFSIAFFKITLRRLSYSLYKENKKFDQIQDKYYSSLKIYGQVTQTERLEMLARKNSLYKKKKGQIIQVIDGKALVVD